MNPCHSNKQVVLHLIDQFSRFLLQVCNDLYSVYILPIQKLEVKLISGDSHEKECRDIG